MKIYVGDLFCMHCITVSQKFHKVLDVINMKLSHLIKLPDYQQEGKPYQPDIKDFHKMCCNINDCTEIFMKHLLDLLAHIQM